MPARAGSTSVAKQTTKTIDILYTGASCNYTSLIKSLPGRREWVRLPILVTWTYLLNVFDQRNN